jgi:hypothetical protein
MGGVRMTIPRLLHAAVLGLLLVGSTSMTASVAHAEDPRDFTLHNHTSWTFTYVYVSPVSSNSWGDDILGSEILSPGQDTDVDFTGVPMDSCAYDIRVVGRDEGRVLRNVNLCSRASVVFSDNTGSSVAPTRPDSGPLVGPNDGPPPGWTPPTTIPIDPGPIFVPHFF